PIVSFNNLRKLSSSKFSLYSILNPSRYLITSNRCKPSTSSNILIGGNPYSSADTPSGNMIELFVVQEDDEHSCDVVVSYRW
ncbi:RNA-directed RNA polymerase, partial [Candida maltosa Xu316]